MGFGSDDAKDRLRDQLRLEDQIKQQQAAQAAQDKKIEEQRLAAIRARRGRSVRSSLVPQPNQTLG